MIALVFFQFFFNSDSGKYIPVSLHYSSVFGYDIDEHIQLIFNSYNELLSASLFPVMTSAIEELKPDEWPE